MPEKSDEIEALIVDIDGTLVDSNYQHVLAWQRAFAAFDIAAEAWKVHRYVGKGGDQMVASVAGETAEQAHGDEIREAESENFQELIDEVRPFEDASGFLNEMHGRGLRLILASSAKGNEVDHYLGLLDATEAIHGHTNSSDVDATKPEPDLVLAALSKREGRKALMIGDSIWDVESSKRAEIDCLAVLTGGFSKAELRSAGAKEIQPSLSDLIQLPAGRVARDRTDRISG
ncbi:MAG: hypothetical protein QG596_41 [Actinomycetota bacterium]|nr:hypothetical protein [Actinomycetota bacterium]